MKRLLMWVLWPSFLAAGVAGAVLFWLVDPLDVTVLGRQPAGRELVYAGGFFLLWAMAAFSSALSLYMSRGAGKDEAEDDWA
jgi:hypothetical protein